MGVMRTDFCCRIVSILFIIFDFLKGEEVKI